MADAITALIGAIIMIGYVVLIAAKLSATPLWVVSIIGLALMLWGFWRDDWHPLLKREQK